jgi:flagellar M-ring protein FliF
MNDAVAGKAADTGTVLSIGQPAGNGGGTKAQGGLAGRLADMRERIASLALAQKLMLGAAAVLLLAVVIATALAGRPKDDYRVLFSNVVERDGAAIVAALQQMNVPYRFTEGGGAILVPEANVHETRLRLAGQGLPKGGAVGFELLENQRLGTSQFVEQVNYQRGLEGELAKTIQSISQVKGARVHLAIPKSSAFSRDGQKPTASVVLTLHPGRFLDELQITAMTSLVSAAVPQLNPQSVTVMDGDGNMLAPNPGRMGALGLDAAQLKYVAEVESALGKRVAAIVEPVTGRENVRAQVTVEMDFNQVDRTEETFRPNSAPEKSAIRSQQSLEAAGPISTAGGIPGALTNQPPQPAQVPIEAQPPTQQASAASGAQAPPAGAAAAVTNNAARKESTVNYEVDRAIQTTKTARGQVKRLSAAVVVNYKRVVDKAGKVSQQPYSADEVRQITQSVRDAMGFNAQRGDSVSVSNIPFNVETPEVTPVWRDAGFQAMTQQALKAVLLAAVVGVVFFAVVRPLLFPPPAPEVSDEQMLDQAMDERTKAELFALSPAARERRVRQIELDRQRRAAEEEERQLIIEAERAEEEARRQRELEEKRRAEADRAEEYDELLAYTRRYVSEEPSVTFALFKHWLSEEAEEKK